MENALYFLQIPPIYSYRNGDTNAKPIRSTWNGFEHQRSSVNWLSLATVYYGSSFTFAWYRSGGENVKAGSLEVYCE